MRKIISGAIFSICLINPLWAQDITIKWAERIPTKTKVVLLGGKDGRFFTTHTSKKDELMGRIYDANLNLIEEKQIAFNLDSKKYQYRGAYFMPSNIVHFIEDQDRKADKVQIYTAYSDMQLNSNEKINIVDETELKDNKTVAIGSHEISPDSSKILLYHENIVNRKEANTLVYKVYNADFSEVINQGEASLPIKARNFITEKRKVDNLGNVYVLVRITKERSERSKGDAMYYYKLVVIAKDHSVKEFDFDYPDGQIESFEIFAGKDNTFICTGFLRDVGFVERDKVSDRMFFAAINCNTLELRNSSLNTVEGLYPDKVKSYTDKTPYHVRNVYQKSDGGYTIVAEQYKVEVKQNGKSVFYYYYYCDIAIITVDNQGKTLAVSRIPKYQKNAANPSLIATAKNDKTYVIYEDLLDNMTAEEEERVRRKSGKAGGRSALFLLTIDNKGAFDKKILYSYKEVDINPILADSKVVSDGTILLNANDQIGIVTFE